MEHNKKLEKGELLMVDLIQQLNTIVMTEV